MADVSIANLPAFVGSGTATGDLLAMVDISDTSESPLGTTKRITFAQVVNNINGNVTVNGTVTASAFVVPPDPGGGVLRITGGARIQNGQFVVAANVSEDAGTVLVNNSTSGYGVAITGGTNGRYALSVADQAGNSLLAVTSATAAGNARTLVNGRFHVMANVANDNSAVFVNDDPAGYGLFTRGGDGSHYALGVTDRLNTLLLSIATGQTHVLTASFLADGTGDFQGAYVAANGGGIALGTRNGLLRLQRVGPSAANLLGDDNGLANLQVYTLLANGTLSVASDATISGYATISGGATISGSAAIGGSATIGSTLVIGADPGGSQTLRVSGGAHFDTVVVTANAPELSAIAMFNTSTTGVGLYSKGGGNGTSRFLAQFANYLGAVRAEFFDPSGVSNATSLRVTTTTAGGANSTFSIVQAHIAGQGVSGLPPGARVLYVI